MIRNTTLGAILIADPERRVAESRLYRALVGRVYEAACDARTQALPELRDIRAGRVEVFDRIEATQAPLLGASPVSRSDADRQSATANPVSAAYGHTHAVRLWKIW
jgi:hypothetical protein